MKLGWLAFLGRIMTALFGSKDGEREAYDEGTQYGVTKNQNEVNLETVKRAQEANATRDAVGRMPARAQRDELRSWDTGKAERIPD